MDPRAIDPVVTRIVFDVTWPTLSTSNPHRKRRRSRQENARRDEAVAWPFPVAYASCTSLSDIFAAVQFCNSAKNVLTTPISVPNKYFAKRSLLWSLWHENDAIRGPVMDFVGWYSVTPECIARHVAHAIAMIATEYIQGPRTHLAASLTPHAVVEEPTTPTERVPGFALLDLFCGCGGDTIAAACTPDIEHVISVEQDPARLAAAIHNAILYGVVDRITFVLGDAVLLLLNATKALEMRSTLSGVGSACSLQICVPPLVSGVAARAFRLCSVDDIKWRVTVHPEVLEPVTTTTCTGCWYDLGAIYLAPPWGGMDYTRTRAGDGTLEAEVSLANLQAATCQIPAISPTPKSDEGLSEPQAASAACPETDSDPLATVPITSSDLILHFGREGVCVDATSDCGPGGLQVGSTLNTTKGHTLSHEHPAVQLPLAAGGLHVDVEQVGLRDTGFDSSLPGSVPLAAACTRPSLALADMPQVLASFETFSELKLPVRVSERHMKAIGSDSETGLHLRSSQACSGTVPHGFSIVHDINIFVQSQLASQLDSLLSMSDGSGVVGAGRSEPCASLNGVRLLAMALAIAPVVGLYLPRSIVYSEVRADVAAAARLAALITKSTFIAPLVSMEEQYVGRYARFATGVIVYISREPAPSRLQCIQDTLRPVLAGPGPGSGAGI